MGPRPGQFESDNNPNFKDDGIELIAYRGRYYLAASLNDNSTADIGSDLAFDLAIDVSGDAEDGPLLIAATWHPA